MGFSVFGNDSDIVHWKPNPTTRGTFDILSVCVITTSLCVWSAVHLNVPHPGETWRRVGRRIMWMLLALVAPEIVAYTAWAQRRKASRLVAKYNKTFGLTGSVRSSLKVRSFLTSCRGRWKGRGSLKKTPTIALEERNRTDTTTSSSERHAWTITHGFYAVMGGYILSIPKLPPSKAFIPNQQPETWTVADYGVAVLLKCPHAKHDIPDLSVADIMAKSRASSIVKSITCIQATWFCIQCLTRLAEKLPISLLELNTFAHAICALIIYLLWWEKPFDVDSGTPIDSETLLGYRAYLWMKENPTKESRKMLRCVLDYQIEFGGLDRWEKHPELEVESGIIQKISESDLSDESIGLSMASTESLTDKIILKPGEKLPGTGYRILPSDPSGEDRSLYVGDIGGLSIPRDILKDLPDIELDATSTLRWRLAWLATKLNGTPPVSFWGPFWGRSILEPRCGEWTINRITKDRGFSFSIILASLTYGGLHLLAWNASFSSREERILWRLSAATVACGGLVVVLSRHFNRFVRWQWEKWELLTELFDNGFTCLVFIFYLLARTYLVVESVIGLSHLPSAAYEVPSWSAYFPHIA